MCTDDLWKTFEARAAALECSVDWLLGEAMKRLLESGPGARDELEPAPPEASKQLPPLRRPPPPPPPPKRTSAPGIVLVVDGKRTPVDRSPFVLGRSGRDAHLVLRDPGVSRQHAIIERFGAAFVIVDMASMNGVIVNGSRVARAVLRPGDVVHIGPFSLIVERGGVV